MGAVEPIAIVGIGCRLPGEVRSAGDLWSLLVNGVDAITEVPKERWHLPSVYHPDPSRPGRMISRCGGFLNNIDRFDAQFFGISPREAAPADPQQRLLLEVAYEAVEDAGLTLSSLAGKRAAVHVGISSYDYGALQLDSIDRASIDAYTNLGLALCIAANRISYFFNLIGPSLVVDTACSSSLVATHLACQSIWTGESELALAAGVNVIVRPEAGIGFSKASMLSPDGRCKSFDSRANGYVRGEGLGVVILKPLARALADRDQIYALIRATAVNQDGRTTGISVPNRSSQEANLRDALRLADIAPESVQYVEAHGTGTPVGDPIEAAALGAVYGHARKPDDCCVIGSIKSNVGHLEAASGIVGLIKTALCLQHRQIPASLHFENPNPQIPFADLRLRVARQLEPWPETVVHPPRAGVNSFGFGGTNAHAILEAPPARRVRPHAYAEPDDGRAWMLPLSARGSSALSDLARSYLSSLGNERGLMHATLRDICFSAGAKRSHHEFRLALAAHDKAELAEQLEAFLWGEARANSSIGRKSDAPSRPVFVCSGMGQQWWAMGRELLAHEPVYRQTIERVSDLFGVHSGWSLLDKLTADETSSRIHETHIGQPAIFSLQVALAALWRSWGVEPAAVFGHSVGEIAASHISGALSLEDAVQIVFHRSRLQSRVAGQGAMLAAGISLAEAKRLVERHPQSISIAAANGPRSITLSGDAGALAEIDKALNEAGQFSRALQVEVPYHSQKMESLETELVDCLRDIRPRTASTPLFSTVTGATLMGPELDARYWYRNIRQPVLFHDAMGELIRGGHRLFLEIGAHPVLRYDIGECLNEASSEGTALASLRRGDRERATMLGSLGRLYALGAEIDWQKLFPADATPVKLPSYPFQAETHWREPEQSRRRRLRPSIHPLLEARLKAAQPTWNVELDTADLGYLADHRIGDSIVFPGMGYVEMALALARETLGSGPCVLEDVEFQKFLVIDEQGARSVQAVLESSSSGFAVYSCADVPDDPWDLHARGSVRQLSEPAPAAVDLAELRERCPAPMDREEYYRLLADMGFNYGPTFQAIVHLWRGDRQALAEIHVPAALHEQSSDYRLHPAVMDACIQSVLAAVPERAIWSTTHGKAWVPVRIERLSYHASPSLRIFSCVQLRELRASELKADIQVLDENGNCLADVRGLVCRPTAHQAQRINRNLFEYLWKPSPHALRGVRDSHHLPSMEELDPVMREEGENLRRRFDRRRFQNEFQSRSRATAAAYIVRALRQLGWTPAPCVPIAIDALAERLAIVPQYRRLLRLLLKELTPQEIASTADPGQLWKALWHDFPECQVEALLCRLCGEKLPAVLRGDIDPLNLLFPEGSFTTVEHLYQDSPSFRINNLVVQGAVVEVVKRLPAGKALRILEIGGGIGGTTSYILPILPQHCCEYVFTDVSQRFTSYAQVKFAQYQNVQFRALDIERDPLEQGFEAHSFDIILASDVLHVTQDLRKTLSRVKRLLGSCGMVIFLELTCPSLLATLVFGQQKGWWLFDEDDTRRDQPSVSPDQWKTLLREVGFSAPICIGDYPDLELSQHSVILARGPDVGASPPSVPQSPREPRAWLLFSDNGVGGRPSAGAMLARALMERGDRVVDVTHGAEFGERNGSSFTIRAGNPDDMRRLLDDLGRRVPRLAGAVHLWSLDTKTTEATTSDDLVSSAKLGCVGALQLVQALAATDSLVVDGVWLATRGVQPIENRDGTPDAAQSPLWGVGRAAPNENRTLHCCRVDLTTCSREEIEFLAEAMTAADRAEDEIVLHGELKYVHRLVPVAPTVAHSLGRRTGAACEPFRIELQWPGILDSLWARPVLRASPRPNEVEIEIAAAGLNFKDLMRTMGMLPEDAASDDPSSPCLGMECAGRVVAVGDEVLQFAVGDEVIAGTTGTLATHVTVDARFVARKPQHLSLEQVATIPVAFLTAFYSLHTLGQLRSGERVLIHCATGGVGLAAVQLALKAGAIVFATAGSPEKRELLSALGVPHVMDSRSLAFADQVLHLTQGEGVDLVLNSLAGEAINKSLSLLRQGGRFIEIGKTDIYKDRKIGMRPLRKGASLFVVELSEAFQQQTDLMPSLLREVLRRFESKDLSPLPHRVFPVARIADAFRYMAQAKHVGKLIISMKDAAGLQVERRPRPAAIDADGSYLITGGLGGFGLAAADRLARRGARHLALAGRSGPSPTAQAAVDALRRRGVEVTVFQMDVADREQVKNVIAAIQRTTHPLRGIMHAAMVLDDAPIERLNEERMWKAMAPKILGAWNLHALTAETPLDFFVLFSSIASIIGNPGQTNYVAGNVFLDTLAHYRRRRGLPALVVNWGIVGDVGHVARSPETSGRLDRLGFKAMPVAKMLDALDELMCGNAVQVGVAQIEWGEVLRSTAARIPARFAGLAGETGAEDGHSSASSRGRDMLEADPAALPALLETYIRDHLAKAMGAPPARIDTQQSLINLGLDSLIAMEVRNRINADLGVNIPISKFMQSVSISALAAYTAERLLDIDRGAGSTATVPRIAADAEPDAAIRSEDAADLLARIDVMSDEEVDRQLGIETASGRN
jgi:acyl transferase domain-containing protein/NADPH:quinone reductase-like Zn-dependent oxidoreductase/acyl carrier protein